LAINDNRSGGRRYKSCDHLKGRSFAASGGTEKGDKLTALDVEVYFANSVYLSCIGL
jgi:hypothetical protein